MVVETLDQISGPRGSLGLHVGVKNVQQHFPLEIQHVELELDHLVILCRLEASFWTERPEIHDFRLSSWLESKRNRGIFSVEPAPVAMIPSGNGSFRLRILAHGEIHDPQWNGTIPYASQVNSSAKLLDRRRDKLERTPERRKVARIKSNASPPTNA